jgi:hypothetical protein
MSRGVRLPPHKKLLKKLKNLLTKNKKSVIIIIQGKERNKKPLGKFQKKVKKGLDKLPLVCYNNNVR